jgi:hypothetical protein
MVLYNSRRTLQGSRVAGRTQGPPLSLRPYPWATAPAADFQARPRLCRWLEPTDRNPEERVSGPCSGGWKPGWLDLTRGDSST